MLNIFADAVTADLAEATHYVLACFSMNGGVMLVGPFTTFDEAASFAVTDKGYGTPEQYSVLEVRKADEHTFHG